MEVTDDPSLPSGNSSCLTDQQRSRAAPFVEKEHLFDKVVTPSDVGKLNRLVIPKQHAEKHFPLDAAANEKGLILNFEDRTGRSWRFRYSYWNSSQSYVMTRGWSRFVKEKRLDAGDTVSFGRGVGATGRGRLFIDWKHRPDPHDLLRLPHLNLPSQNYYHHHQDPSLVMPFVVRTGIPLNRLVWPPPTLAASTVTTCDHQASLGYGYNPYLYWRPEAGPPQAAVQLGVGSSGEGGLSDSGVFNSVPVLESNAVAKTVRLFGVNLYCSAAEADRDDGAVGQDEKMGSQYPSA